jgi:hypothetical protein
MGYSNLTVMLAVVAVVLCILGIAFGATYCLNKAVDEGER